MIDNTMPERLWVFVEEDLFDDSTYYTGLPNADYQDTEYIRADVVQVQLAERDKRIIDLEHELAATRSNLLDRICTLLAEREWMPVSEGLPKPMEDVLVCNKQLVSVGYITQGEFAFWNIDAWSTGDVTHWMPLPPTPQS